MKRTSGSRGTRRARKPQEAAPEAEPTFVGVDWIAASMGVGEMSIYRAIHSGRLPALKFGGRYLVPFRALEDLVERAMSGDGLVDFEDLASVDKPGSA